MAVAEAKPDSSGGSEPSGSLSTALSHAARLLETRPAMAERQAEEILLVVPNNAEALLILGIATRLNGKIAESRHGAGGAGRRPSLLARRPLPARHDAGRRQRDGGGRARAGPRHRAQAADERSLARAGRSRHDARRQRGTADRHYGRQIKTSVTNPILLEAAGALVDNRLAVAERTLKGFLKHLPTDVTAIRMLAEVAARIGRFADAETLLRRCLELAPSFVPARHNYALALLRQGKVAEALAEVERLLRHDPYDPGYRNLKAAVLGQIGDYEETIALYEGVLRDHPNQPKVWMSYGHALKTAGRGPDGITAYRRSIEQMPGLGEAYWSLANLKTFRFTDDELGGDAGPACPARSRRHRPAASALRARQGAGGRRRVRRVLHPLCRGQSHPKGAAGL